MPKTAIFNKLPYSDILDEFDDHTVLMMTQIDITDDLLGYVIDLLYIVDILFLSKIY